MRVDYLYFFKEYFFVIFALTIVSSNVFAYEQIYYDYMKRKGDVVFLMDGDGRRNESYGSPLGLGRAYKINSDASIDLIWESSGWWSHDDNIYLSSNGRYLVRVEYFHDYFPDSTRLDGVVFYKDGIEVKRYSPIDLVDQDKVYQFNSDAVYISDFKIKFWAHDASIVDGSLFFLETYGCIDYVFSLESGEIEKINNKCLSD